MTADHGFAERRSFAIAVGGDLHAALAMDFYFDCYGELCLQRTMVADRPRTDAFAAAIKEVVRAGDRIIDVGTGSGLLAMLAARAGAERVYALDQASVLEVAEQVVRANGLADQVEAVRCNARDFQLAEPADLMISEWLGHFGFAEAMFQDVMRCRVDNLRKGGRMLPSGIELKIAPVESEALYDEDGPGFWRKEVHGVDFSLLERLELEQGVALKTNIYPEDLLAPGEVILDLDLAEADEDSPWQSGEVAFVLERSGRLDGFAGWFAAQLSPSVKLDTAPGAPLTHWQQTYFPFRGVAVEKGQALTVKYSLRRHPVETRSIEVELTVDGERLNYLVG